MDARPTLIEIDKGDRGHRVGKTEEGWIMLKLDVSKSGSFRIGGEIEVNRLLRVSS